MLSHLQNVLFTKIYNKSEKDRLSNNKCLESKY